MDVYSEKNQRVPEAEDSDFELNGLQTIIPIQKIKDILEEQ